MRPAWRTTPPEPTLTSSHALCAWKYSWTPSPLWCAAAALEPEEFSLPSVLTLCCIARPQPCGHSTCCHCLSLWLNLGNTRCPSCNTRITHAVLSFALRDAAEHAHSVLIASRRQMLQLERPVSFCRTVEAPYSLQRVLTHLRREAAGEEPDGARLLGSIGIVVAAISILGLLTIYSYAASSNLLTIYGYTSVYATEGTSFITVASLISSVILGALVQRLGVQQFLQLEREIWRAIRQAAGAVPPPPLEGLPAEPVRAVRILAGDLLRNTSILFLLAWLMLVAVVFVVTFRHFFDELAAAEAAAAAAVAAEPDGASLAQTMAQQADRMLDVASRLFARLPAQLLQVFVVTFLGVFTVLFTTQILIQGAARLAR